MQDNLFLLLAENSSFESTRMIAKVSIGIFLFAGILKCVQIARRPTTSSLCVLSLALFLIAWLFSILLNDLSDSKAY
ncbi:MAG: hypothetical protein MI725_06900, partial [Pirellulales bacterium]|nr:hypothetical protein [Pirellulales bacterium]